MSVVGELYEVTKEFHAFLQQSFSQEERDEAIAGIEKFLEKRDRLIEQVKPPFSKEDQQLGKNIIPLNEEIDTMLEALQFEIKTDIRRLNLQKEKGQAYSNPYASAGTADGMFFDKRK